MTDTSDTLLKTVQDMVTDVNSVNGTNDKIERLGFYSQLKPFLKLLMDPLETTGITSVQLKKYEEKCAATPAASKKQKTAPAINVHNDIMGLLGHLYRRDYSGNEAKDIVLDFIKRHPSHRDLIHKIIDKNLQIRMDVKQINYAFPGFIYVFLSRAFRRR